MQTNLNRRVYVRNLPWGARWRDLKDHMKQSGEVVRADIFLDETGRSRGWGIVEYARSEDAGRAINELNGSKLLDRVIYIREDRDEPLSHEGKRGGGYSGGSYNSSGKGTYPSQQNNSPYNSWGGNYSGYSHNKDEGGGHPPFSHYNSSYSRNSFMRARSSQNYVRGGGRYRRNDYNERNGSGDGSFSRPINREIGATGNPNISYRQLFVSNLPFSASWEEVKETFGRLASVVGGDILFDDKGRPKGSAIVSYSSVEDAKAVIESLHGSDFGGRQLFVRYDQKEHL